MSRHVRHWIGGSPHTGRAGRRGEIHDPATGRVAGTVDFAGRAETDAAVAAAKAAFPGWRDASLARRTKVLFRFRELVDAHRDELAVLISAEHGKVRSDAAVSAGFGSAGERCMAISVVVAVDPVGDELVARIRKRVAGLRVGPGDVPESDMGPLITGPHRDRVASYLDGAVAQGAALVVDGRDPEVIGGAGAGSGSARPSWTTSSPAWTSTRTRSSAPSCRWCGQAPTTPQWN